MGQCPDSEVHPTSSTLGANAGFGELAARRPKRRRPRSEPGPPDGGGGAGYPPQPCSELLDGFAVQRKIEAFALDLLAYPQTDEEIDDLEQDQRDHGVVDEHSDDADALIDDLLHVAIERAGGSAVLLD